MSPSRDDNKRSRIGGRNKFDRLSSSILSSDWNSPAQTDAPDWPSDNRPLADANTYIELPPGKHSPAPMRGRLPVTKRPQRPSKAGGWGPTVVFGILVGIASFGFAFDFATDGKIRTFFGLGTAPVSDTAAGDSSSVVMQLPTPQEQMVAKVSEPAMAVAPSPAQTQLPLSPPIVQAPIPVPETPQPIAVEKLPVVSAPIAAKAEPAVLPIPEPEKTVLPVPSLSQKAADAEVAVTPADEAPKAAVVPEVLSTEARPATPAASPTALVAQAQEQVVEPATPEVAPIPAAPPQPTTAPAPPVVQTIQRGNVLRDCADCPQLVAVPAGSFVTKGDMKLGTGSRTITINHDFAIGRYEVTFDDWNKCVMDRGCLAVSNDGGWGRDRRPVIFVSYEDINTQYLPWLSRLTGNTYRLPSKDEWQYAAAGGASMAQGAGQSSSASPECSSAVGAAPAACATTLNGTSPVGSFPPSALGIYDMEGNVWEWSADCWQPFSSAPKSSNSTCDMRIVLGGAWSTTRNELSQQAVGWEKVEKRTNSIGFRIVRSLP